jgi:hypothetical protein
MFFDIPEIKLLFNLNNVCCVELKESIKTEGKDVFSVIVELVNGNKKYIHCDNKEEQLELYNAICSARI